jgi:hypothetical protein
VKNTLLELAAELAHTLPQQAPLLLEDVRDLSPALTTCKKGCTHCKANKTGGENPGPSTDGWQGLPGPQPDDDGSAGPSAVLTRSLGSSEAVLPEITGSKPRGGAG